MPPCRDAPRQSVRRCHACFPAVARKIAPQSFCAAPPSRGQAYHHNLCTINLPPAWAVFTTCTRKPVFSRGSLPVNDREERWKSAVPVTFGISPQDATRERNRNYGIKKLVESW